LTKKLNQKQIVTPKTRGWGCWRKAGIKFRAKTKNPLFTNYIFEYFSSIITYPSCTTNKYLDYSNEFSIIVNIPNNFSLSQNYPNPFNPTTKIYYSLPKEAFINIKLYDVLGNNIATLVNAVKPEGRHEVIFDANIVSSGIYYYRIQADHYIYIKKMIILK